MAQRRARARGPIEWLCHTCGAKFRAYAPVERHVDEAHRGGRIEVLIPLLEARA